MESNAEKKCNVHLNPKFANKPHINRNFPFASGGLHINPNFVGSQVLNAISQETQFKSATSTSSYVENQITPQIHFNPKLLHICQTPGALSDIPSESVNQCNYVHRSKNKIVKAPIATKALNPLEALQHNPPPIIKNKIVPKKPSYSLVRKLEIKSDIPKLTLHNLSQSLQFNKLGYNIDKTLSTNKVWERKPCTVLTKNKYQLCNNNTLVQRKKIVKVNQFKLNNTRSLQSKRSLVSATSNLVLHRNVVERISLQPKTSSAFVFIRGEKYIVSNRGLKKVSHKAFTNTNMPLNTKHVKKICLSGITYVRKSSNVFVVDNRTENAVKKRKKINITCPVFRRLGICHKQSEGKCPLIHNPKNISICGKFIKGLCTIDGCHLSHEVVLEKMPTCKFFLEGCCVRESCPYLHVKVNDSAKVCLDFLQGYCADAVNCTSVHIYVCPEFYKYLKCDRIKCPYPHKKPEYKGPVMPSSVQLGHFPSSKKNSKQMEVSCNVLDPEEKSLRYFQESTGTSEATKQSDENVAFKGRPKLGTLPSFISLE